MPDPLGILPFGLRVASVYAFSMIAFRHLTQRDKNATNGTLNYWQNKKQGARISISN